MSRISLKVAGSSGSGLVITGTLLMKALKHQGFYINADREYPSLIKGGYANYQIDFDAVPIHSLSRETDILVCVDRVGLRNGIHSVKPGGIVIHDDDRHHLVAGLDEIAKAKNLHVLYLPARTIAHENGGNLQMTNMVILGLIWKVLGFPPETMEAVLAKKFGSKPALLELDLKCLRGGFAAFDHTEHPNLALPHPESVPDGLLIDGNTALSLGAIHAGVRAYYAYPMSPSSSILSYLAKVADKTGMIVKQAEDEITVAQMTLGSMYVGTRALCATSGGGYDLMTETVSLAAMIEVPLVVVVVQRPGPATGLPTWSAQGDLNLAIYSAHGEFPRIVIGVSDPDSCFTLIQEAFNLAEEFQVPVIVLSEKIVAESKRVIPPFKSEEIPIRRGLVTDAKELENLTSADRFDLTASGVSKRWLPGTSEAQYYSNSDEHREDGRLTENGAEIKQMVEKRMRKEKAILDALPAPQIFGESQNADVSFIGWGSTKNIMLDIIDECAAKGMRVNYLHYDFLWPLKPEMAQQFFVENPNVCLLEGNYLGQFGTLIENATGKKFKKRFLKYDGRQFFREDVLEYIEEITGKQILNKS